MRKEETAMRGSGISGCKRAAAAILGVTMLVLLLLSAFCIAAEADHDCTGEDCQICACIRQCEQSLHRIIDGAMAQAVVIVPLLALLLAAFLFAFVLQQKTPVSGKVRLND